jgi:predicted nucleic acid-binding Zn ribbon protein
MRRQGPRSGTLQPVAPVVTQTLQQVGLGRIALLAQIVRHWEDIVGSHIAGVAYPEGVRARVLFVTVTDAIWLQQLTFCQAQMLQKLRHVLGDVPITRVHFTLATLPRLTRTATELAPEPPPVSLTSAEEQQVLESTAAIADAELREAVRRAWRRGWGAKR